MATAAEDLRAFGLSEEKVAQAIDQMAPAVADAVFTVYARNAQAVRLFQAMGSQWRTISLSTSSRAVLRRTGLHYEVLDRVATFAGLDSPVSPDTFGRLQMMESTAITAWQKREARAG